jgi:hypothetical protein
MCYGPGNSTRKTDKRLLATSVSQSAPQLGTSSVAQAASTTPSKTPVPLSRRHSPTAPSEVSTTSTDQSHLLFPQSTPSLPLRELGEHDWLLPESLLFGGNDLREAAFELFPSLVQDDPAVMETLLKEPASGTAPITPVAQQPLSTPLTQLQQWFPAATTATTTLDAPVPLNGSRKFVSSGIGNVYIYQHVLSHCATQKPQVHYQRPLPSRRNLRKQNNPP